MRVVVAPRPRHALRSTGPAARAFMTLGRARGPAEEAAAGAAVAPSPPGDALAYPGEGAGRLVGRGATPTTTLAIGGVDVARWRFAETPQAFRALRRPSSPPSARRLVAEPPGVSSQNAFPQRAANGAKCLADAAKRHPATLRNAVSRFRNATLHAPRMAENASSARHHLTS